MAFASIESDLEPGTLVNHVPFVLDEFWIS